jgi:two-component system, chemotaxis family, protein-glutamate methylesterase/glutaminase
VGDERGRRAGSHDEGGSGQGIVVIGASAGGLEPLVQVVQGLPEHFPCPVLVVVHMPSSARSSLSEILDRQGTLAAGVATDGQPMAPGRILVAPPGQHLIVESGCARLVPGPTTDRARRSVDVLFRSAAATYGAATVGVVLSGALDDGTEGLAAIRAAGGVTIVQDPREAVVPGMPEAALAAGVVDHVAPGALIASLLIDLMPERVPASTRSSPIGRPT